MIIIIVDAPETGTDTERRGRYKQSITPCNLLQMLNNHNDTRFEIF